MEAVEARTESVYEADHGCKDEKIKVKVLYHLFGRKRTRSETDTVVRNKAQTVGTADNGVGQLCVGYFQKPGWLNLDSVTLYNNLVVGCAGVISVWYLISSHLLPLHSHSDFLTSPTTASPKRPVISSGSVVLVEAVYSLSHQQSLWTSKKDRATPHKYKVIACHFNTGFTTPHMSQGNRSLEEIA
ncbi:hypothetical protein KIL84_020660 [Mauremys mutica]|uniref:Uncharacterized protein n=1 Tax=Mauremys mutica TaxID=74926 RepID=A0A9D3XA30_9SAUR|nr:hypothetical protein KIL84_020660 [Mauremys mutica]